MRSLLLRVKSRRALAFAAALAVLGRVLYPAPPPRTLQGLAEMLGSAASGKVVPSDIVWEPSPGVLAELLWGRGVLFLASTEEGGARDLYRARVRVTLEGRPVTVSGIHDLTTTPLGDEQKLVISDQKVAFATASFGKVESVTLLDLAGTPELPGGSWIDGATSAITNWRETGRTVGIGRLDVSFDEPDNAVTLAFDHGILQIGRGAGHADSSLDLSTGSLVVNAGANGAHVSQTPSLRKRPILWAVDTVRAEVGPEPVAAIEALVFNARDLVRRSLYAVFGTESAAPAPPGILPVEPAPRALDASYAQLDNGVWPPPPISPTFKNGEPGEGVWEPVTYPWLKHLSFAEDPPKTPSPEGARTAAMAPPYFYTTMVRPDPDRPYAKVLVVAMDMRQLELDMEAGVEDPKPLTGARGSGKIPRDPRILSRVVGAFNGAFKTTHGEYGMMVHRRVLLPPKPLSATVVVSLDRRVGLGTWGTSATIPSDMVSFRQNLEPLIEDGKLSPSGRTQWGWQLSGTSMMTERSGLCVTASGLLYYLWGDEVSAATLGRAMILAGCTYGMHLDMNPHHTGFVFANVRSLATKDYDAKLLTQQMEILPERYLEYSPKDFFYLMLRDPTPPGDIAWTEDLGTQPAPVWLPTVWRAMVQSNVGPSEAPVQVELLAFDSGRVLWRVRTARQQEGQKRDYQSSELGTDDQHRVVAAIGLGNPHEGKDTTKSAFSRFPVGGLVADETSGLTILAEGGTWGDAQEADRDKDETLMLPLILDGSKVAPAARESRSMRRRGAVCVTPGGLTIVAMATTESDEAAALALQRVGCERAVSLDRGSHRPAFLHRPGAGSPPLARYDESVLYAISRPMSPRAYRWASPPVPPASAPP